MVPGEDLIRGFAGCGMSGRRTSSGAPLRVHPAFPVWRPDTDGWIGENSLRQPEDLDVSFLGLIERLGQESALTGANNDYGYKDRGHHEGGGTGGLP